MSDTRRDNHSADGLSRRDALLRIGAGGLAAALLAHTTTPAAAQEGTPVPDTGLPPGVGFTVFTSLVIPDPPPGPFSITLSRTTLDGGSVLPDAAFPFSSLIYVESGVAICPGDAPRWFIPAGGAATEIGGEEITLNPGDALYIPANVVDGIRNDGTEQAVVLGCDITPVDASATPTT